MKYLNKKSLTLALIFFVGYLSMYNSSGSYSSNGDRTGAFSNGTCATGTSCHNSTGSFSPTTTLQLFDGTTAVTSYTSNHSYTLRITTSSTGTGSSTKYGFQAVSVKSTNNSNINGWGTMPSSTKTLTISGRTYASHSTRMSTGIVNIPWTSPATSTGNITFYAVGMVADGNFGRTGDNVATTSLTVSASTGGCSKPTNTPSITHVDCFGDNTGAISITTTGGTSPYIYSWTGPNSFSSSSKNISNLVAGQYRLVVTATGGCKDTINPKVNQPSSKLTLAPLSNATYCIGDNIALSASGSGGTGTITYSWTGPQSFSSSNPSPSISQAAINHTGKYYISITDTKNCSASDSLDITVDSMPMISNMVVQKIAENTYKFSMDNPRFVASQTWLFGDGKNSTIASINHTYITKSAFIAKLIITNHCGSDTFSKNIFNWPTSISALQKETSRISIYPNPSNTHVNITSKHNNNINGIVITSLEGMIVHQQQIKGVQSLTLNTIKYPTGLYIVRVNTQSDIQSHLLKITH